MDKTIPHLDIDIVNLIEYWEATNIGQKCKYNIDKELGQSYLQEKLQEKVARYTVIRFFEIMEKNGIIFPLSKSIVELVIEGPNIVLD